MINILFLGIMQSGVRQLKEIIVYYAPTSGSSSGVRYIISILLLFHVCRVLFIFHNSIFREFLFNGPLARWMVDNPHVAVKTYKRGSRHPFMIAKHRTLC